MLTTNLVFSEWNRIFKDPMTTLAAIDRVVHHSVILDMMGAESYRATEAHHQHLHQQEEAQTFSKEEPRAESATIIVATSKNY